MFISPCFPDFPFPPDLREAGRAQAAETEHRQDQDGQGKRPAIIAEVHVPHSYFLIDCVTPAPAFKIADRRIILRDGVVSDGGFVKSLQGDHDDIVRTIYL
ncbi:MAG TPA: hypothetical protein QGF63_03390 [Alphaproteobacteria bacterium]|nr:hypothetical protein [Alphaproteobacteria bacterium]HJM48872.1 hypothetical protein [Alphaproteobacteria bacterium]